MSYTWVEPFAGAAAVALRLVGGSSLMPPVAWMGGKRRYAREIADVMGVPEGRPGRVVLSDAGPWGWVWPLLLGPESGLVCDHLRSWAEEHPRQLWDRLAAAPPAEDLAERAAQWLWLQARSASGVPVWWSGWRLETGSGKPPSDRGEDLRWPAHQAQREEWLASDGRGDPRPVGQKSLGGWEQGSGAGRDPQPAGQRGEWRMGEEVKKSKRGDRPATQGKGGSWKQSDHGSGREQRATQTGGGWLMGKSEGRGSSQQAWQKGQSKGATGGMVNPSTIAERVEAIRLAFEGVSWQVRHGDAAELAPGPAFVLLDPPYVGCTGYGWDCPRETVAGLAQAWRMSGAVVAICEAEPLELDGWHALDLTRPGGKAEWLTVSRGPAKLPDRLRQRTLFGGSR